MHHESAIFLTDYWLPVNNLYPTEINISSLIILLLRIPGDYYLSLLKSLIRSWQLFSPNFALRFTNFFAACTFFNTLPSFFLTLSSLLVLIQAPTWDGWFSGDVKERRVDNVLIMTRSRGGSCKDIPVPGSRWWYPICRSFLSLFAFRAHLRDLDCVIVANAFTPTVSSRELAVYRYRCCARFHLCAMKEGRKFKLLRIRIFGTGWNMII